MKKFFILFFPIIFLFLWACELEFDDKWWKRTDLIIENYYNNKFQKEFSNIKTMSDYYKYNEWCFIFVEGYEDSIIISRYSRWTSSYDKKKCELPNISKIEVDYMLDWKKIKTDILKLNKFWEFKYKIWANYWNIFPWNTEYVFKFYRKNYSKPIIKKISMKYLEKIVWKIDRKIFYYKLFIEADKKNCILPYDKLITDKHILSYKKTHKIHDIDFCLPKYTLYWNVILNIPPILDKIEITYCGKKTILAYKASFKYTITKEDIKKCKINYSGLSSKIKVVYLKNNKRIMEEFLDIPAFYYSSEKTIRFVNHGSFNVAVNYDDFISNLYVYNQWKLNYISFNGNYIKKIWKNCLNFEYYHENMKICYNKENYMKKSGVKY